MRIFFVIALLASLGAAYYYNQLNRVRWQKVHEECLAVEAEIKQCDTAAQVIRKEQRRLAVLQAENRRLKAQLGTKKK
ncbi:MAG: hypothetical protein U0931_14220 [Vulcanimicrobiota bacterium]